MMKKRITLNTWVFDLYSKQKFANLETQIFFLFGDHGSVHYCYPTQIHQSSCLTDNRFSVTRITLVLSLPVVSR